MRGEWQVEVGELWLRARGVSQLDLAFARQRYTLAPPIPVLADRLSLGAGCDPTLVRSLE
jgi:hypothetical protein